MAHSGPFSTAATKRSASSPSPASDHVTSGGVEPARVLVRPQRELARAVRVHKVEALVLDALEQRGLGGRRHLRPAHVGNHGRLQQLDGARPLVEASRLLAVLDAALEHDLHAHADAQHRAPAREAPADDLVAAAPRAGPPSRGEGAHARHHEAVGVLGRRAVGGQGDIRAHVLKRAHRRAHIAKAVVEGRSPVGMAAILRGDCRCASSLACSRDVRSDLNALNLPMWASKTLSG